MIKLFLQNFRKLPESNKAMVYLMWIYSVWALIAYTFINIYVFKIHNSFKDIIIYNILLFTSNFFWFSIIWWIMSILKKNIKNLFYIAYLFFILSFLSLFIFKQNAIYIFWILYWLWNGSFRCAVHTQELKNIEDINRDFYSSSISAWRNILQIITPLLISLIFYITNILNFDWYLILFLTLPALYLSSFFIIKKIDSYTPKKITLLDFKNFFNFKKYKFWHLYFLVWWWLIRSLEMVLIPIISIVLLKNEINIGLFQWILTILSTYVVINLSSKRNKNTRLKYFFIISILIFISNITLWLYFSLSIFVFFSLATILLSPIFRVSEHVYDLELMDYIKTDDNDFYPAMIMRDFVTWIWRILALIILYILLESSTIDTINILKSWLILRWFFIILTPFTILLRQKYEKKLIRL